MALYPSVCLAVAMSFLLLIRKSLIGFMNFFRSKFILKSSNFFRLIGSLLVRVFPLFAIASCVAGLLLMEAEYENNYDARYHQGIVDTAMTWSDFSLSFGANPTSNFGIQQPINAKLSPTFWLGHMVDSDIRIPVQAAFQSVFMLLIFVAICRACGAPLHEAFAIGLIAIGYCWVPLLSNGAIPFNATLGLPWQEGAIATLLAFFFFIRIGVSEQSMTLWPALGMAATIFWFFLFSPYNLPFVVLATAILCIGIMLAIDSKREFLLKSVSSIVIIVALLLFGVADYILNLFLYTSQMYYKILNPGFGGLINLNTSMLARALFLEPHRLHYIYVFFIFVAIGGLTGLYYGNRVARRVVYGGACFVPLGHILSAINSSLEVAPMAFLYVEQTGAPVLALLAGTGVWFVLRVTCIVVSKVFDRVCAELTSSRFFGWTGGGRS